MLNLATIQTEEKQGYAVHKSATKSRTSKIKNIQAFTQIDKRANTHRAGSEQEKNTNIGKRQYTQKMQTKKYLPKFDTNIENLRFRSSVTTFSSY